MNTDRGIFIAIEGTDGSGKGTQFRLLAKRLTEAGYDVAAFDFPQYDLPSSYFVREYLNGKYGTADEVGPYTASLFYALDRFEAAPQIRKALEEGKVVLTNRYVGSNMAHQGTKFRHAEERRGYFIWLDNLEFEMLHIPRPTTSIVLRVPAETSQKLVDQKGQRSYTEKKRDIHEADLQHLQRAVDVYDDMCQLFPKDFSRIDCTREGTLLDIETISAIIWQKIEPILPAQKAKKPKSAIATAPVTDQTQTIEQPKKKTPEPPTATAAPGAQSIHTALRDVSILASKRIEWSRLASYVELPHHLIAYDQKTKQGNYRYHVPQYFEPQLKERYCAHMDQIFNLYSEIIKRLTEHLASKQTDNGSNNQDLRDSIRMQAIGVARAVLPTAATTTVGVHGTAAAIESIINNLLSYALPESYDAGKNLLTNARKLVPTFMDNSDLASDVAYRITNRKRLASIAKQYLHETYSSPATGVQLTGVFPRNELDVIADMLYGFSSSSLKELEEETTKWPYARKAEVLDAYIGKRAHHNQRPGRALEKVRYSWDLLCEFDTFRELQRHTTVDALDWQDLTPRYGYEVPKIIEDADLVDQFESCFDLSLRLYSAIQEAGYTHEAQYATLLGHRMRWKLTYNARAAFQIHELRSGPHNRPEVRKLVSEMHEKLCAVHPLIGEAMVFHHQQS
jgi:dTMP kinase